MPNFFLYLGPNGGPPSGSFIATLEYIAEYMIKCISKMQREHILSMEVRQEALESFSQQVEKYFAKTIFTYKCRSWFKRNQDDGKVVGLWPGSNTHAQQALLNPRYEDFTYVHMEDARDNILSWLGNGLTVAQIENGATTAYLDNVDVPPILNHTKRPKKSPSQNTTPAIALSASAANGIVAHEDANGDGDKGSGGFATGF
ncbi:hypothetical protein LTR84_010565 [Exophiala bonariae]|uniref:Uncharacterized protein n=1 Tax=Exophiala bonariae TaxID=1690606 RepID=A0AAV9MVX2_9EURO|nr:hypothetical protein LTR84_010565 [Exophiala bonariae]